VGTTTDRGRVEIAKPAPARWIGLSHWFWAVCIRRKESAQLSVEFEAQILSPPRMRDASGRDDLHKGGKKTKTVMLLVILNGTVMLGSLRGQGLVQGPVV
jgi:hypothetical protein